MLDRLVAVARTSLPGFEAAAVPRERTVGTTERMDIEERRGTK
jgi:hypothetical protein